MHNFTGGSNLTPISSSTQLDQASSRLLAGELMWPSDYQMRQISYRKPSFCVAMLTGGFVTLTCRDLWMPEANSHETHLIGCLNLHTHSRLQQLIFGIRWLHWFRDPVYVRGHHLFYRNVVEVETPLLAWYRTIISSRMCCKISLLCISQRAVGYAQIAPKLRICEKAIL